MRLVVLADEEGKTELERKNKNEFLNIEYAGNYADLSSYKEADAFFILGENFNLNMLTSIPEKPVFINSVTTTLSDLNLPGNISRINAWSTFLQRNVWEIATKDEPTVKNVFDKIGWKFIVVPDKPGFVAARIIAMIINEAYFALQQRVSTKAEIDIAMKLGTNYPYGPFEWAQKIGLNNIYNLLKILNRSSGRYTIASALENEIIANSKPAK